MIAVQTVSTKKLITNPFKDQLMMYWVHSVNSINKFYDTILITDRKGAELAKHYDMPYNKVFTYLDGLGEKDVNYLLSFIKFYYLDKITDDFVQFDWDVFIYERLKDFDNFIFQSNEGKCYGCFDFNLLKVEFPYDSNINSINTGTFGMKKRHMSVFKEYKDYVLKHINNIQSLHTSSTIPHLIYDATSFVEETYIVKLLAKQGIKYDTVIERDYDKVQEHRFFSTPTKRLNFSDKYDNTTFDLLDKNYKYYHLIGFHKNTLENAQRANIRFMEEFPNAFAKTVHQLRK